MTNDDNIGTRRFTVQRADAFATVFELDSVPLDGDGSTMARECIAAQDGIYDLRGNFFRCSTNDNIQEVTS